ncbi:exopolysaccharide biosynthesis protein [Gilvimarinus sp. DA14]|uniref:exopolysaccharide biosynthesis protein n=1 Tax=Gilvimarinus sp. DA14 TaxID=2956798 RepID=UPI0020B6E9AC|nr:exopolysaccharide biosynthesis protein [Gilvimarinus sp. DA14]UTF59214.1 exopolysaccharide biosynthesis protein [Gilvimarinus sp. DA14]
MENLTATIEQIEDAERGEKIHVGKVMEAFSSRGFGPLLLLPSLITFLPTGGIPGVPAVCGVLIILIAVQLLLGRSRPWIPSRLEKLGVDRERFVKLLDKSKRFTQKIDKVIRPRYQFLSEPLAIRCEAVLIIALAASLIPLGPIPFAAAIPSGILVLISLGIVSRDGLLIMVGMALSAIAAILFFM